MDSNYIINRLKSATHRYPTVNLLKARLSNLDPQSKAMIIVTLKKQLHLESNVDIQIELNELIYQRIL